MPPGDSPDRLRWQDDALQILYWLRGEGLLADAGVADLRRFLDGDPEELSSVLERLVTLGFVRRTTGEGARIRYALTADGVREPKNRRAVVTRRQRASIPPSIGLFAEKLDTGIHQS